MSTTTVVSADELLHLPMGRGQRYELVLGKLRVMSAAGWQHGMIVANVQYLLGAYIHTHRSGRGFGAETGFILTRNPDTVRAPDFAFIAREHLPTTDPADAYWPGAPDLAVEVLSPDDRKVEVAEKVEAWLSAGCAVVWVIDPRKQTVAIHQSPTDSQVLSAEDTVTGDPLLPGFTCAVKEFFA
jgi:Uma2 family endonuclease